MASLYPWLKALHIIVVMAWMASLLYLPRLFVNHVGLAKGSEASEMLKGMERRLMRAIMRPSAVMTFLFGGALLSTGVVDWSMGWIYVKLASVLIMFGIHGFLEMCLAKFARDANTYSSRFFRIINEVPALLMIVIVIMVAVKPF